MVVAAAHSSEWGSAGAAVLVCEALEADCVLPHDDGAAAVMLAATLAQHRGRPLAMVRGTLRPLGADALLLASPEPALDETPAWIRPALDLVEGRVSFARRAGMDLGPLRAFPPGAGRLGPAVLLWLSPFARRVMSGADQSGWSRPELLELARRRGMGLLRADGALWVAAGRDAPDPRAVGRAELIARTGDVAQLVSRASEARLSLLLDEAHGVVALAVEQGSRRALVLGGDRREERAVVDAPAAAALALRRGARTLLAARGDR